MLNAPNNEAHWCGVQAASKWSAMLYVFVNFLILGGYMATSIPVDVMRDIRMKIYNMRQEAKGLFESGNALKQKGEFLISEANNLETIADGWKKSFPDTEDV
jgi:hypothetical protein